MADSDRPDPLEHLTDRERHDALLRLLGRLSERERKIVKLRLGIECDAPHTLARIAEMLQVSRERIRQIEHRALIKLRNAHASVSRVKASSVMH